MPKCSEKRLSRISWGSTVSTHEQLIVAWGRILYIPLLKKGWGKRLNARRQNAVNVIGPSQPLMLSLLGAGTLGSRLQPARVTLRTRILERMARQTGTLVEHGKLGMRAALEDR